MKQIIATAAAIVLTALVIFAARYSIATNVHELNGTVTSIEQTESATVIICDVTYTNGQIHEWAFYGDSTYKIGDAVMLTIDLKNDIIQNAEHA